MSEKAQTPRRSVLDLAPLELDCMNTLWPMGEGTVRQIRDQLAERRPRAYTTIMTIMDRLARKGVVERRKVGRAYVYRPNLSAEEARSQALGQVVDNFFGGSPEALLDQLNSGLLAEKRSGATANPPLDHGVRAAAAAASVITMPSPSHAASRQSAIAAPTRPQERAPLTASPRSADTDNSIDETLL
ncbi:MAG TPA: BlaI/MecI/CopY family transcriptional regulator [Candidatus Acidoferrum sp.]|nr:BlaI/MecI/CopY family transcriptional regulator [Candidatus Acidoferrum sp.]